MRIVRFCQASVEKVTRSSHSNATFQDLSYASLLPVLAQGNEYLIWRIEWHYTCYTSYFQQNPNIQHMHKLYWVHPHELLQSGLITNTVYHL